MASYEYNEWEIYRTFEQFMFYHVSESKFSTTYHHIRHPSDKFKWQVLREIIGYHHGPFMWHECLSVFHNNSIQFANTNKLHAIDLVVGGCHEC